MIRTTIYLDCIEPKGTQFCSCRHDFQLIESILQIQYPTIEAIYIAFKPNNWKNCPEVGYCALPFFGLEADWGRGGVGIMIWGVKKGGSWRMVRVPDQRHGGQGHS